mgnify:CR=1 FL=1
MKSLIFILSLALTTQLAVAKPAKYEVNSGKSQLKWTGKKVTGQHYGYVKIKEGHLKLDGKELVGGEFTMDMTSITVEDIEEKKWNRKLNNHLRSDDFFHVSKHKTAKLKIKDAQFGKGGKYNVFAELTIKDETHPVQFDVSLDRKEDAVEGKTKITFDRTKFGIKYRSGNFFENLGDKMIYDDVQIDVKLVANRS